MTGIPPAATPSQPPASLAAHGLVLGYGGTPVVDGLDLTVADGRLTALIGPNGCGKSTLLRALARVLAPQAGAVLLDGQPILSQATAAVARRLSYLPQSPGAPPGLTVRELVAHGRFPHRHGLRGLGHADHAAIDAALTATGLRDLADRDLDSLSGGQRQRAWIAVALCQGARTILLDEPTNHLDLAHQLEVLDLLRALTGAGGHSVVIVLHDLQLAARYADQVIAIDGGRIAAHGTPLEVIRPDLLRTVFGIEADVIADPVTGAPLCLPRAIARRSAIGG